MYNIAWTVISPGYLFRLCNLPYPKGPLQTEQPTNCFLQFWKCLCIKHSWQQISNRLPKLKMIPFGTEKSYIWETVEASSHLADFCVFTLILYWVVRITGWLILTLVQFYWAVFSICKLEIVSNQEAFVVILPMKQHTAVVHQHQFQKSFAR